MEKTPYEVCLEKRVKILEDMVAYYKQDNSNIVGSLVEHPEILPAFPDEVSLIRVAEIKTGYSNYRYAVNARTMLPSALNYTAQYFMRDPRAEDASFLYNRILPQMHEEFIEAIGNTIFKEQNG